MRQMRPVDAPASRRRRTPAVRRPSASDRSELAAAIGADSVLSDRASPLALSATTPRCSAARHPPVVCLPAHHRPRWHAVCGSPGATTGRSSPVGPGTGLAGGAVPVGRPGGHLHHPDEPDPRARRRPTGGPGCSRASSTSTSTVAWRAPRAAGSPRIRRASRPAPSAETSPTTAVDRTAWRSGSPPPTCSASRSSCPTRRWCASGGQEPDPTGLRPARCVRGQRGHAGYRHRGAAATGSPSRARRHPAVHLRRPRRGRRRASRTSSVPASCRRRWR